ncbi:HORMA domain-containing protein [Orobanche minor]
MATASDDSSDSRKNPPDDSESRKKARKMKKQEKKEAGRIRIEKKGASFTDSSASNSNSNSNSSTSVSSTASSAAPVSSAVPVVVNLHSVNCGLSEYNALSDSCLKNFSSLTIDFTNETVFLEGRVLNRTYLPNFSFLLIRGKANTSIQCVVSTEMREFLKKVPRFATVQLSGVVNTAAKAVRDASQRDIEVKVLKVFHVKKPVSIDKPKKEFQIKDFMRVLLFTIVHGRNIFPENYFCKKPVPWKSKKKNNYPKLNPVDREALRFIDWITKGAYDAYDNKFLRELLFCVCTTNKGPMIEEYTLSLDYPENPENLAITDVQREAQGVSFEKMTRTLSTIMRVIPKLQENCCISMKLLHDELTPNEYEPPLFRRCKPDEPQFKWNSLVMSGEAGQVGHELAVSVRYAGKQMVQVGMGELKANIGHFKGEKDDEGEGEGEGVGDNTPELMGVIKAKQVEIQDAEKGPNQPNLVKHSCVKDVDINLEDVKPQNPPGGATSVALFGATDKMCPVCNTPLILLSPPGEESPQKREKKRFRKDASTAEELCQVKRGKIQKE